MRRRILFVEQNTDGTVGGSHHSLLILVQNLDHSRFEPTVVFYERHPLIPEFERVAKVVVWPPLEPVRALDSGAGLLLRKAVNLSRAVADVIGRTARIAGALRPDIIHLNNSILTGLEWPMTARLSGAFLVVHQRGFAEPPRYTRRFDRIICISRDVRDQLLRAAPDLGPRVVQIHNGIDTDAFIERARAVPRARTREELGVGADDLLIGLVGNLQPWKGQHVLLEALPRLASRQAWQVALVGRAPASDEGRAYEEQLRALTRSLGLESRVRFVGYRTEMAPVVDALDIMVHTSVAPEPMGRVILEGMALGKPVIATDQGGPREIVEHDRSGFLVPPGDADALAACLDRVMEDPLLRARVGRDAATRIAQVFSAREYAARVAEVYESLWSQAAGVVEARRT